MEEIIKNTTKTLMDIEPITTLIQNSINNGIKLFEKKRNENIKNFYNELLKGNVSEEQIKYEIELIKANENDFYNILSASIYDEEQEKISIYVHIYKYIRENQQLSKKEKTFYLKAGKEISYTGFFLIAKFYTNFMLGKYKDPYSFSKVLGESTSNEYNYDLSILSKFGYCVFSSIYYANIVSINKDIHVFFDNNYLIPENFE
ncbi:hypothetical protein [Halarcobacter sp.]|uniref:hypothetical protein n=1 Tax=Halarcobacter sp. TaxID=2321133 RepID=UPI0029F51688|nr:hypothetical protein [Halarcobacter sp.]